MIDRQPDDAPDTGIEVAAPVARVCVLEDRAQVTRAAELELAAGRHRLRVGGVSPLVADHSLRCCLQAPADAGPGATGRVIDTGLRRHYRVRAARPEREQELRAAIESQHDALVQLHDRQLGRFHERELIADALAALRQQVQDRLLVGPFDPGWAEDLQRLFSYRAELERALLEGQWAQDDRRLDLEQLLEQLGAALAPVPEYGAVLEAELEVAAGGRWTIAFEYQVPCALWRPSYTAHLEEQTDAAELDWTSDGTVWQATGEDWLDVELSLSTDRPSLGAELPLLEDDVLRSRPKTERERQVVEVESRDQVIARTADVETVSADTPPGVDDGGQVRTFQVPERVDVPGDGRPHRIAFERWRTTVQRDRMCAPALASHVYLRTEQDNPSRRPLLAGPVQLFRGGGYTGRGEVRFVNPGERFALSWGSDDGLVVLRDEERRDERSGVRRRRIHRRRVTIDLANHSGRPRELQLLERVPVSELEQVQVELDEGKTSPGFERDAQGLVRWTIALAPGKQRRVTLAFALIMPRDVVWDG